jgi:hypothetical protein
VPVTLHEWAGELHRRDTPWVGRTIENGKAKQLKLLSASEERVACELSRVRIRREGERLPPRNLLQPNGDNDSRNRLKLFATESG